MMASLPTPLRLLLLIALSSSTCAAVPASRIFSRQSTCATEGFDQCGDDFPDYFCCQTGTRCLSLAGQTTVMCCPEGARCESLKPITCNIRAQDAEKDPQVPLKTTVFDVDLEKCGDNGCCPFGFSCVEGDGGKECTMDKDQSEKPQGSTSTATAKPTSEPTGTSTDTPTSTDTSTAETGASRDGSESGSADDTNSGPNTASIIGGVVGTCAFLLLVAVILFVCLRKRARRQSKRPEMRHGRNISEPITQPDMYRSEFMLRPNQGSETELNAQSDVDGSTVARKPVPRGFSSRFSLRRSRPRLSIPNHFANASPNPDCSETGSRASTISYDDGTVRTGRVAGARLAPIRSMKASETRGLYAKSSHLRPEFAAYPPSNVYGTSENINVFADPATVKDDEKGYARETRFSDLMNQADLGEVQKGKPYVPTGTTPRI